MYEASDDPRDAGAHVVTVPPARGTLTALFGLSLALSVVGGWWSEIGDRRAIYKLPTTDSRSPPIKF